MLTEGVFLNRVVGGLQNAKAVLETTATVTTAMRSERMMAMRGFFSMADFE
jgi:hypothetical protein